MCVCACRREQPKKETNICATREFPRNYPLGGGGGGGGPLFLGGDLSEGGPVAPEGQGAALETAGETEREGREEE